jgi:integrase/recombinase XerD
MLAPNTVTQRLAALRFLYTQVLKRSWSAAETPYPKKVLHLPHVLSQKEVARLIDAAEMPFHRILLMTLYATGGRRSLFPGNRWHTASRPVTTKVLWTACQAAERAGLEHKLIHPHILPA